MLLRLFAGCSMMALCVIIHAGGVTWALRYLRRIIGPSPGFWSSTWLFIRVAVLIVFLHLVEISAWAALYVWNGALADVTSAMYFSAVTYTTTGYGDVVLPPPWRLQGGIEALTGILMCGWSTGFFFAIVNRLYGRQA
jgi:hypothetical protein